MKGQMDDSSAVPSKLGASAVASGMQCEKCGCEHFDIAGPLIVCGIETYCKVCDECGHRWDPE